MFKGKDPLISIIIPSYNSQRYIEKCLNSLVKQKTNLSYEIIVVDSSKDSTQKIITEKFPTVKLIRLNKQTYPGAGRNIGIKNAKGKITTFIDSDCIAHPNWLNDALSAINKGYSVVGGSVRNANPQTLISVADYILAFNEFFPSMPKKEVSFMPTCNFICRREVFDKIGGFPPDLLAGEDTLFNHKAAKEYKLLFDPNIKIAHNNRDDFKRFFFHHYNFGKYSAMLRKKYNLSGSFLAKFPLFAFFAPGIKLIRISNRMLFKNWKLLPQFLLTIPLVLLGVSLWGIGFVRKSFHLK